MAENEASSWEENVASVREPLYESDHMHDHEISSSDSWDDDSEPENDLSNWRVERLSREEFIAVSINASYNKFVTKLWFHEINIHLYIYNTYLC